MSDNAAPDWAALVAAAGPSRPPVVAQEFIESLPSASQPQKFRCNDGRVYAVKFKGNPYGNGRAIYTEQVVALLGHLIGVPVAEVELVSVTAELLGALNITIGGVPAQAGIHHGSRWQDGFSDRADFIRYAEQNREAFGALRVLYSWVHCAGDHQVIYRNEEPHDVLSVDHSCFIADQAGWSVETLRSLQDACQFDQQFDPLGLTEEECSAAVDRLEAITNEEIAHVAATPPDEWGIPPAEREAFAGYVSRRRLRLLANFGRETG